MGNGMSSLPLDSMRGLLSGISSLVSWKTMALILVIINLKNMPLFWHVRILYYFVRNIRWRVQDPHFPRGKALVTHTGKPTHPVFVSYSISSRAPILETDYNQHKSNSTYFSDLDIARTALVTRLYSPGASIVSRELDAELLEASQRDGTKPPKRRGIYVALGSVYCSFKREIKPFELYEMESKVIAWDQKWMYVMTFFLRPASRKGGEKTLFATAVSKYVVKKGRLTVPPERVLRASGFLPPRPAGSATPEVADSNEPSGVGTPAGGEGLPANVSGVDGSLVREVLKLQGEEKPEQSAAEQKSNAETWDSGEWTWERIEQERLRGLTVVEGYTTMDAKLYEEWQH
ncbi:acyl-CoA thioesterase [Aspergillus clavatus NRRL 1]|uniref:Capsule polysaccharide biosynthesis protein n=1 Tax=Aspergillus clavatus (strain ATCC 1007 / CBS 513.65 / DSM 816 / NCTC 3887 / NRRL 1 / QM 1276 / 107) TaxID=344612 RepID=A1CPP1_ASPCL|nr:uncharacterized protein ACLA_023260 [Aspergillus clavatus NRRL 1]EAW07612.1 conserved hypothetical protein [Aspergillus clavatus NRRL 1]